MNQNERKKKTTSEMKGVRVNGNKQNMKEYIRM